MSADPKEDGQARQAAGRPEGNAGKAWIRTSYPEREKPKPAPAWRGATGLWSPPLRQPPRACYVRELEGGGTLILLDDGSFRTAPKSSPPEGEGWEPLHDEAGAEPSEKAQNRRSAKKERKARAERERGERTDRALDDTLEGGEGGASSGGGEQASGGTGRGPDGGGSGQA